MHSHKAALAMQKAEITRAMLSNSEVEAAEAKAEVLKAIAFYASAMEDREEAEARNYNAEALAAGEAMLSKQSAAKNVAALKDVVDAILENEEAFENMAFADALDVLEAELSGWDCLGARII